MSKAKDFLARAGGNLDESLGANRAARADGMDATVSAAPSRHDGTSRLRSAAEIDVDRIAPDPDQPRTEFDRGALVRLAASLETHGQLQPITVRWSEPMGRYLIVSGERRWRAAALAGRPTIAAVVLDGEPGGSRVLEMQLIENCLREDLKPIEQARAFRALMDRNGWTASNLAEALHLNRPMVSRALALLELPDAVRRAVEAGELPASTAYEVSKLDGPAAQREVAERVVAEGMTRDGAAEAVRAVRSRRPPPAARPDPVTLDLGDGCTVAVRWRKAGGPTAVQALRRAVRMVQEQGRECAGEGDDRAA
jgi:ParB family transcriptional regulator, chromosome partitioning protein